MTGSTDYIPNHNTELYGIEVILDDFGVERPVVKGAIERPIVAWRPAVLEGSEVLVPCCLGSPDISTFVYDKTTGIVTSVYTGVTYQNMETALASLGCPDD